MLWFEVGTSRYNPSPSAAIPCAECGRRGVDGVDKADDETKSDACLACRADFVDCRRFGFGESGITHSKLNGLNVRIGNAATDNSFAAGLQLRCLSCFPKGLQLLGSTSAFIGA